MRQLLLITAFLLPVCAFSQREKTICINEIMADPNGLTAFPKTEYVELHNRTDAPIQLEGWVFLYGDNKETPLASLSLPAYGYVVLYGARHEISIDSQGLGMPLEDFPRNLANAGKTLSLRNPSGEWVDRITYEKATPGVSWERSGENLYLSKDERGGTPGSINSHSEEKPSDPEEPKDPDEPELPDTSSFPVGSVRINEVMADPKGQISFPETEYVELYNTTDKPIELKGWSFLYGDKQTALTALLLDAGGYAVLYRSGREVRIDGSGQGMPLDKFPSALANTGKELVLLDPSGKEIDRIAYEKAKAGIAWERAEAGFYLSTDQRGGTPGSANSSPDVEPEDPDRPETPDQPDDLPNRIVLPHEIVFNELLPNPYPEGSEYIELYNRSDQALPLAGLSIATRKSDGRLGTHYPLSSITSLLEPQAYALLTKSKEGVSDFYLISSPDALHELKLPVLANTSATLVLFRAEDEVVIDEIRYSSKWHAPSVKDEKGVALERIHPDGDTQDEANWTSASATAGYGTPGYRNSQEGKPEEGEATGIESPVYSEITREYTIHYHLDQSGYTCRAWVFDISGKRICEVVNHDLLGVEGELTWNGLASNGSKVKTGVYIFYVELVHPQGKVERYREVFLVK